VAADTDAFVFNDAEGHYYVIPREVIERGIISDESKAKVEAALTDTSGFMLSEHAFSFVGPLRLSAESQNALRRPDGEPPIMFIGRAEW
jgi:hypothetical protein